MKETPANKRSHQQKRLSSKGGVTTEAHATEPETIIKSNDLLHPQKRIKKVVMKSFFRPAENRKSRPQTEMEVLKTES